MWGRSVRRGVARVCLAGVATASAVAPCRAQARGDVEAWRGTEFRVAPTIADSEVASRSQEQPAAPPGRGIDPAVPGSVPDPGPVAAPVPDEEAGPRLESERDRYIERRLRGEVAESAVGAAEAARAADTGGYPLEDPKWQKDRRVYRNVTAGFAGLSAGLLLSFVIFPLARPYDGCYGDCQEQTPLSERDHRYDRAEIRLGVAAGFAVLGLIISASLYERHLNRAVPTGLGPAPTWRLVTDPRGDPAWRRKDRRLTRGIRATAVLAGIGGAAAATIWSRYRFGDSGIEFTAGLPLAVLSVVSMIALGAQAAARRRHRRQIPAWPRLGVGGLMLRF